MPFCTACGRQNPDDANFCAQCGTRLVALGAEPGAQTTSTMQIGQIGQLSQVTQAGLRPGQDPTETSDRALTAVDAAAVDALPVGHALLVVQKGPGAGSRFLLDTDVVNAGRHPESEIFLDDVTVSRRHAVFRRQGDTFTVEDAGSLNGTYVNRDRIETTSLRDSDEVQIGKYRLVFFAGHEDRG
ncbi:FHA domain-containing protein [Nocardioides sp.]|uniref:FHA domain-containing protein n=1 Tax=Nocardioides sp. TaxID=35761 RepID=UPI0035151037